MEPHRSCCEWEPRMDALLPELYTDDMIPLSRGPCSELSSSGSSSKIAESQDAAVGTGPPKGGASTLALAIPFNRSPSPREACTPGTR